MGRYLVRRFFLLVPTMLGVTVVVFALMRLVPGDVVDVMLGSDVVMSPSERAILHAMYGLDQPIPVQYARWLGSLVHGDLGTSLRQARPVRDIIFQRVGISTELALLSICLSTLIAVPLGVLAAVRRNGFVDVAAHAVTLFGLSIPYFWLAALLLLVTSVYLRWHPSLIWVSPFEDPSTNLQQVLLPVLSLSAGLMAIVMRMSRSSMLEVLSEEYIRTARAKGLGAWTVLAVHGLKNAAIPVVTVIGLQVGYLLGGIVVIEQIFGLPGIGLMMLDGIFQRDYPVVQGGVVFVAVVFVLVNIVVDMVYGLLDPRVRYS